MTESFNDPRRLFRLWKELTGEDLLDDLKTELRSTRNEVHKKS